MNFRYPHALTRTFPRLAVALLLAVTSVNRGNSQSPPPGDSAAYRSALSRAVRSAAEKVLPAVVTIEIVGAGDRAVGDVRHEASTSGVVVGADGYILASSIIAKHPAASVLALLPDGTRHAAAVVAQDHHRDLILLKIDPPEPLQTLPLTDSLTPQIGQTVIAVGRYGTEATPTVSSGILSGTDRLDGVALQTDARVSAAFYGGPLVDLHGNVLGILIPAVAEGGAEDETSWYDSGIAFAIPADMIARKLDRLRQGEDIRRGLIGIVAKSNDPYEEDTTIAAVRTRSPAEEAGLKAGDQVTAVAEMPVRRHQQIKQLLGPFDAGDTIEVEVRRDGEPRSFDITLVDNIPPLEPQRLGIVVARHRSDEADDREESSDTEEPSDTGGLIVRAVLPDSPADGMLSPGDVIERAGEAEVREPRSLRRLLITAEPDTPLSLRVRRDESTESISIRPTGIAGPLRSDYPEAWAAGDPQDWSIEPLSLPDTPNQAAVLRPKAETPAAEQAGAGDKGLGLLVYLLNPGETSPEEALAGWTEPAAESGVVLCAIAPEDDERWQAKEVEVVSRMVASLTKQLPIEPSAVAVAAAGSLATNSAEASDSMALAVAMTEARTFAGVAVSEQTRPPQIRVRENEPSAALQLLLPIAPETDLPGWGETLESRGYPIVRGGTMTRESLLRWTRCLQAI